MLEKASIDQLQKACEICFWSVDTASGVVEVGPGWSSMLGYEASRLPDRLDLWLDLFHPVDKAEIETLLRLPSFKRPTVLEARVRDQDGQWCWVRLKGRRLLETTRVVGMAEEVTLARTLALRSEERRRAAEEALRRSEEMYRGLYLHTTEHLFMVSVDERGEFRYAGTNPAHQAATGYSETQLKGKTPHECLPPAVADHVTENYQRCLDSKTPIAYEEDLVLTNGPISWLTQLIPLHDTENRIVRLLGICTDLTRLKDQERALRIAQRQESIGRVASGIAHDFNNLLTVIICQLGLMELELEHNTDMVGQVEEISEAARRAAELTRGLLDLAGHSAEQRAPRRWDVAVESLRKILSSLVGPTVELRYQLDQVGPVLGVRVQMDQILLNLVSNAADAMGSAGGTITISTGGQSLGEDSAAALFPEQNLPPGDYVTLEVSDTGPGIESGLLSSIFQARVSSKGEGRGLGLATVKGIVDDMGGGVLVRSMAGAGATFKLFFPRCPGTPAEPPSPSDATPSSLRGRVLYYAGETRLRRALADLQRRLGLETEETAHPSELLSVLARGPGRYQAVVLDIKHKSEQDTLLGAIAAVAPELKVLVISDIPAGELLLGNDYGPPSAVLQKPFELRDLAASLGRLLDTGSAVG